MYKSILKKDLKRKKTMNVIVLLFMILSAMFVSSSVNNIIAVFSGLDGFFDKAGVPDYFIASMDNGNNDKLIETLDSIEEIKSYQIENTIYMGENIKHNGKILATSRTSILMPIDTAKMTYFDENNVPINEIEKGKVYISAKLFDSFDLKKGDNLEIFFDNVSAEYEIAGAVKDAALGSNLMGMSRFILNNDDFDTFNEVNDRFNLCYIMTDDPDAVEKNSGEISSLFSGPRSLIKMSYAMDMTVAGVMMIVSLLLIITAFIVLRFTINFTISEEFREIGVMKAIGIKSRKIRFLYITKYLALSVIGAALGFFASIPFGNMLLDSVSKTMVLESENSLLVSILCSVSVVGIILLFSYFCTRKVTKLTPLDAIRSGQTGERYRKKSLIHLGKSRMKPSRFMAVNDILSSPKRYGMIVLIITLCLSPVLIMANSANTLRSGNLVTTMGFTRSDVYLTNDKLQYSMFSDDGEKFANDYAAEIEQKLADNGMSGKCIFEIQTQTQLTFGDKSCKSTTLKGVGTTTDMYIYEKGTAPQNENEVAITPLIAERLGVGIGDTIKIKRLEGEDDYIVTAFFQCMNNLGEGVRLHESVKLNYSQLSGTSGFQINFDDHPNDGEIEKRIEKMKNIFGTDGIKYFTAAKYVDTMIGVADTMDTVKILILVLSIIVTALVMVLMERSFIEKERGEIAVMKAIGFKSSTVTLHHTLRLGITSIIAAVISASLAIPLTHLTITPIFKMMGAAYGVEYKIEPLEIFLLYPAIIFAVTIISSFLSAQYTRKIKTSEVSGIE